MSPYCECGSFTSASTTISAVALSATAFASCSYVVMPAVVGTGDTLGDAEGAAVVGPGTNGVGTGVKGVGIGVVVGTPVVEAGVGTTLGTGVSAPQTHGVGLRVESARRRELVDPYSVLPAALEM